MCIICNVSCGDLSQVHKNLDIATAFLHEFGQSQQKMRAAADKMLEVSKIACTPADRQRYDAIHKEMVRQIREWNKLEQKREHGSATQGQ